MTRSGYTESEFLGLVATSTVPEIFVLIATVALTVGVALQLLALILMLHTLKRAWARVAQISGRLHSLVSPIIVSTRGLYVDCLPQARTSIRDCHDAALASREIFDFWKSERKRGNKFVRAMVNRASEDAGHIESATAAIRDAAHAVRLISKP